MVFGYGRVDIYTACMEGDADGVRRALSMGADPNAKHRGQTPLLYAAECGHPEVCDLLLSNGAQIDAVDTYNRTALFFACKNVHLEVAELLLRNGAAIDTVCSLGGETVADVTHVRGNLDLVRLVLYSKQHERRASSLTKHAHRLSGSTAATVSAEPSIAAPAPRAIAARDIDDGKLASEMPPRPPAPRQNDLRRDDVGPRPPL